MGRDTSFPKTIESMKIARKDGLVSVAPYFPMLKEGNVRTGFVEPPQFKELLKHLARHLHPLMIFLYTTGARVGMATQITWDMVSTDCRVLHIPAGFARTASP